MTGMWTSNSSQSLFFPGSLIRGGSGQNNHEMDIKLHIVTDIKEKRKSLRWLHEEGAKGLVAIQALYCIAKPPAKPPSYSRTTHGVNPFHYGYELSSQLRNHEISNNLSMWTVLYLIEWLSCLCSFPSEVGTYRFQYMNTHEQHHLIDIAPLNERRRKRQDEIILVNEKDRLILKKIG